MLNTKTAGNSLLRMAYTYESINESGAVLIRTRPEVSMCADAWKRAKSMMVEFGLTPFFPQPSKSGEARRG